MLTRELISKFIKNVNGSVHVHLSNKGIGSAEMPFVIEALKTQGKIDYLNLSNNEITSSSFQQLAEQVLKTLPISKIIFSTNYIHDDDAIFLLSLPHLKQLDISSNGLTDAIVPAILENKNLNILTLEHDNDISKENIKKINAHIMNNRETNKTRDLISRCVTNVYGMMQMNISSMLIDNKEIPLIIEVLQRQDKLDYLNLFDNKISSDNIKKLTEELLKSLPISIINLGSNNIGDVGAINLLSLPHLTRLDISNNGLTDAIVPSVLANKNLNYLNVEGNKKLSEESMQKIKAHIANNNPQITVSSLLSAPELESKSLKSTVVTANSKTDTGGFNFFSNTNNTSSISNSFPLRGTPPEEKTADNNLMPDNANNAQVLKTPVRSAKNK